MEKILIIGASGMFGNTIYRYLNDKKFITLGTVSNKNKIKKFNNKYRKNLISIGKINEKNCDKNLEKILKIIKKKNVTFLINTLGYTPSQGRKKIIYQKTINKIFPRKLQLLTYKNKCHLLHFSTDCVFSGQKGNYKENDYKDTKSSYGKYKSQGELKISKNCCTLRTSGVGHELDNKKSLLEWFLNNKKSTINGYKNAFFTGPTTLEIAKIIKTFFLNKKPKPFGIYNIGTFKISKLELLKLINKIYNKKKTIIPCNKPMIDRSLNLNKFMKKFNYKKKTWKKLITETKRFENDKL